VRAECSVKFEVIDTGIGISADQQDKVFRPFEQATGAEHKGGTGLGLAIARRLVELMGGEIGVESEVGKGSRFWVTVPLAPAARSDEWRVTSDERPASRSVRLKAGVKVKALVVDDVKENREVLSHMLTSLGCVVLTANDGQQGVDVALAERPDIVFMDIRMPVMDGLEAVKRIKSAIRNPQLAMKFVSFSASALAHEQERYAEAGFDDFIAKPFRFERICECLTRLLRVEFAAEPTASDSDGSASLTDRVVPEPLRTRLLEAAASCNLTALNQGLDELAGVGGEGRRLADELRCWVRRYDLEQVRKVLEGTKEWNHEIHETHERGTEEEGGRP